MKFNEWSSQSEKSVLQKETWDLTMCIYVSDSVSWRSTLWVCIYLMSVVGILMYMPKHITALLSEPLLVEARLNSHFRALPRTLHLQFGHKSLKHLTLHVCSMCLRLVNQSNFTAGKNTTCTCRLVTTKSVWNQTSVCLICTALVGRQIPLKRCRSVWSERLEYRATSSGLLVFC